MNWYVDSTEASLVLSSFRLRMLEMGIVKVNILWTCQSEDKAAANPIFCSFFFVSIIYHQFVKKNIRNFELSDKLTVGDGTHSKPPAAFMRVGACLVSIPVRTCNCAVKG